MSPGSCTQASSRPVRSVTPTAMCVAPSGATRTRPASARTASSRGGRPPVERPSSLSTSRPRSSSSATRWVTAPRPSPDSRASSGRDRARPRRTRSSTVTSPSSWSVLTGARMVALVPAPALMAASLPVRHALTSAWPKHNILTRMPKQGRRSIDWPRWPPRFSRNGERPGGRSGGGSCTTFPGPPARSPDPPAATARCPAAAPPRREVPMGKLDGKVAVITGGGRGQGRSHAVRLAQEGADVVICDITTQVGSVPFATGRPGDLEQTVADVEKLDRRCVAVEADVRSTADMERLAGTAMAEFGRIDFLLANAGILSLSDSTWELTDEQWDDMIDINLTGVFKACRAVVPHIRAGGNGGSIIITSSIAGLRGVAGCTHYTAAKHGIVGLMRTLARELAPEMIRVNTIHPTGVDSPMSNNDYFPQWLDEHKELGNAMRFNLMPVDAMPMGDVSAVVAFLCSDEAKWITGSTVQIDAGFMLK